MIGRVLWVGLLALVVVFSRPVAAQAVPPSCPLFLFEETAFETPVTVTPPCSDPDAGSVSFSLAGASPDGTWSFSGPSATFTPKRGFSGGTTVRLTATDSGGETATLIVTVGVGAAVVAPNTPPVVRCDFYNTKLGERLEVSAARGVLANDTDADGDRLETRFMGYDNPWLAVAPLGLKRDGSLLFDSDALRRPLVFSYRYGVWDGRVLTDALVTIGVGRRVRSCREVSEPPAQGPLVNSFTLKRLAGTVRAGPRRLVGSARFDRAMTIDTRRGRVRVAAVQADKLFRYVNRGTFGDGVFRMEVTKNRTPEGQTVTSPFGSLRLVGRMACAGGGGAGRFLEVAAGPGFLVKALRLKVRPLGRRSARFRVADRCDQASAVTVTRGKVDVANHRTREHKRLKAGGTYVVRG